MAYERHVLLTGAGFTANYGGLLAGAFNTRIFNDKNIQSSQKLKGALGRFSNFEDFYNEVLTGAYTQQERDAATQAVLKAYGYIDEVIKHFADSPDESHGICHQKVQRFIQKFAGTQMNTGAFFTLNQDLFVERMQHNGPRPFMPGITAGADWFRPVAQDADHSFFQVNVPDANGVASLPVGYQFHKHLLYGKLHGSMNWRSHGNPNQLVIGHGKAMQIAREPLLTYCFDLFRHVLSLPDRRLLTIGYGFADEHINEVIADAAQNSGLELFVLGPGTHQSVQQMLGSTMHGGVMNQALKGVFPHLLRDLFPWSPYATEPWKNVVNEYFGTSDYDLMLG